MSPSGDQAADIGRLDIAAPAAFEAAVAPLFEGAPRFLGRLAAARPFGAWPALFEAARSIAHHMSEAEQVELVDAHPRLGAAPASVSALSFREQGYDHDGEANPASEAPATAIATELDRLNRAYEARFGFRYCVFVAGRSRSELLPEMAAALTRPRDSELHRALDAVVDIAIDRHRGLATAVPDA